MARKACSTCMASSRVGRRSAPARAARFGLLQHFDDRNQKAERLAGSGLRGGQHVAAFERGRNAAGLHRGGDFKFVGVKPRHQGGRKRELQKTVSSKLSHFLLGSGAARFLRPAIGTGHRGARTHSGARACLFNMRKGEPKVESKTGRKHSRGERPRPGAATRYFIARRHIAGRLHAPTLSMRSRFAAPILIQG